MMREEVYSEYLDNLTILDIDKFVAEGYKIVTSNGHIIAINPKDAKLQWEVEDDA